MPEQPETSESDAKPGWAPHPLILAGILVAVQGVVALALGGIDAVNVRGNRPVVGIGGAIVWVGYGVGLLVLARGLLLARGWSRGPVVATQLLNLPVAWSFWGGATSPIAVSLAAVSLLVLFIVLRPSGTAALVRDRD